MNKSYLCDSYDFVKRMLIQAATNNRGMLAIPMILDATQDDIVERYSKFLSVLTLPALLRAPTRRNAAEWITTINENARPGNYHIFLDPDTGIRTETRLPKDRRQFVGTHEIQQLLSGNDDRLLLCFDQSICRGSENEDRAEKLTDLQDRGIAGMYFRCGIL